jgi:prolyl oligopeptidase
MNSRLNRFVVAVAVALVSAGAQAQFHYPETKTVDHKDVYHGTEVADPYRWLENDVRESQEVADWIAAENKVTFDYLGKLPYRDAIRKKLTQVWNYEKATAPSKQGGRYYFSRNDGLQNQYVIYVQDSLDARPRPILDPNGWSKDGTVALSGYTASDDGRYLAYGVAEAGSDWVTWHVMDVASGKVLDDEIRWVKFSGASWTKDGKGFFYGRYPEPEKGATFQSLNKNMKLYYHRVGTAQADDVLVYERPDDPEVSVGGDVTDDGRYLVITTHKGTDSRNQLFVKDLTEPYGMPVTVFGTFDNEYEVIGNDGPTFYVKTDVDAPRRRLVALDYRRPARSDWKELVPQSESLLDDVAYVGGHLVAEYLKDARSQVKVFGLDGKLVREVTLPGVGKAAGFEGKAGDPETFFSFSSFNVPASIYRYDVATGQQKVFFQPKVTFDPASIEVKQVFYPSKDGTRIPMFLAYRKGLKLNGANPTLLYGYGGFNISQVPAFSPSRVVWMQMGGVLAVANLRGGGEYGEEWHKAGTKLQKQNVFDDFIAAAEWLIAQKYTKPAKLAIQGGSNGGLLVGAAMTQRPDLFGAALPAVGVMDMLRFHKFTAGRFWTDDYGSSDDPAEFKAIYAYSPYHNIKPGVDYPATLITTADHDDRVVPGHSFKFAAALQKAHTGKDPVLIRIETRAGHGAGKPTAKVIEETADLWSFLAANLGMKLPKGF